MSTSVDRRSVLGVAASLFGLGVIGQELRGDEKEKEAEASFVGVWTYRSFLSNPDINVDFDKLEFARATLQIDKAAFGVLRGKLSFGDDYLALKGNISYGSSFAARFQGKGATKATEGWVYDYQGYLVPMWPDGDAQRPAIVGSVIRTVAHSEGKAKAGVVASFIAVKQDK